MLAANEIRVTDEDYAYLPDELLESILLGTADVARDIEESFTQLQQRQQHLRAKLVQEGYVRDVAELEPVPSPSVAAVDGGLAIEKSIGADTVLVAAVGVEGLVREDRRKWNGVQFSHWQQVLPHSGDPSRTAFGVMGALELEIASSAPHDVVIVDGIHLNPIIALNNMLSQKDSELSSLLASFLKEHRVVEALASFLQRPSVVAMVKYDSSSELSQTWFPDHPNRLDDRTLMTILLQPGEYTVPVSIALTPERKSQISDLHIVIGDRDFPQRSLLNESFRNALLLMRDIQVIYYRPWEWAPAYRIELKDAAANSRNRLSATLQAVREQVVSPEIREPYPQHLADQMAKSVSAGLKALRSAIMFEVADSGATTLLRMLAQSYRTE